mmetsp:Transcript_47385/g.138151  ORF Transcript_47385/g.138151 Transcript_47385/m.138151 type:complete len:303 (-) Transcript_47385:1181-2089(-)
MPQDQHGDGDGAHDVPGGRPQQAEERLHGLHAHDLLGVPHAGAELPQQGREVGHEQPPVHGAAEGGHDRGHREASLGVDPDVLVAEALVDGPHRAVEKLAEGVLGDVRPGQCLQAPSHRGGQVRQRSNTALPLSAVEGTRPALAEEGDERCHEVQRDLVQGLGQRQGVREGGFAVLDRRHLDAAGASGLHVEELDALRGVAVAHGLAIEALDLRRVAVQGVVALLVDVPRAADARGGAAVARGVWPQRRAAARPRGRAEATGRAHVQGEAARRAEVGQPPAGTELLRASARARAVGGRAQAR